MNSYHIPEEKLVFLYVIKEDFCRLLVTVILKFIPCSESM